MAYINKAKGRNLLLHTSNQTVFKQNVDQTLDSAPIVKTGMVKRPKLDEDEFDMVLKADNDTSVSFALPKLEPIKLEEITQDDRITMLQTPGKTEMDKVKIFFRSRYPEYAGRWDQDDNWLECPVQVDYYFYNGFKKVSFNFSKRVFILVFLGENCCEMEDSIWESEW